MGERVQFTYQLPRLRYSERQDPSPPGQWRYRCPPILRRSILQYGHLLLCRFSSSSLGSLRRLLSNLARKDRSVVHLILRILETFTSSRLDVLPHELAFLVVSETCKGKARASYRKPPAKNFQVSPTTRSRRHAPFDSN